jgi:hypothetical protein
MSYSNPIVITYPLGLFDFGGGAAESLAIRAPAGYENGRLIDIGVSVSEVFLTGLTNGHVQIGTGADPDAYAKLVIPSGQADASYCNTSVDTDAIIVPDVGATELEVTLTNGTDSGTVSGQGHVSVTIAWF